MFHGGWSVVEYGKDGLYPLGFVDTEWRWILCIVGAVIGAFEALQVRKWVVALKGLYSLWEDM